MTPLVMTSQATFVVGLKCIHGIIIMVSHTHFNVTHSCNYGNFGVTTFAHNSLKFNLLHIYT